MPATAKEEYLEAAYQELGFHDQKLVKTYEISSLNEEDYLTIGGWVELAKEVGADSLFFHNDNPVIVFTKSESSDPKVLSSLYNRIWSMSRPKLLFLALENELRVYDLGRAPSSDIDWVQQSPLQIVRNVAEVGEKLKYLRVEQLLTGKLFEEKHFGTYGHRPDTTLLDDLKFARLTLIKSGLAIEYAHSLIGRSIFIRYLEDRGIVTRSYFEEVAAENEEWLSVLSSPLQNNINTNTQHIFYPKVLTNFEFTYALFKKLAKDFNGDIFTDTDTEKSIVQPKHLELLKDLLTSNVGEQKNIFLWAYDFKIVPIELISSIYEEFYHSSTAKKDNKGTHYTPLALAEFVLTRILTKERLLRKPKVLDPACGSAIFLVEAFKRIVRFETFQNKKRLSPGELRNILKTQIAGIEVNPEAIKVAAFSLYLALLHYQNPPDIIEQIKKGYHLPHLIYNNNSSGELNFDILLNANAFEIEHQFLKASALQNFGEGSADIVVGNPPWGSKGDADLQDKQLMKPAVDWCKSNKHPVGDRERSQMFIWRSISFLKRGGACGLLVSTGIFFKLNETSEEFRRAWLKTVKLNEVINFVPVRHIFFASAKKKAIAPFAAVFFEKESVTPNQRHLFKYWSARKSATVNALKVVILHRTDLRVINQFDVREDSTLWKVYWWGSHKDHALINYLRVFTPLGNMESLEGQTRITKGLGYLLGSKKYESAFTYKYLDLGKQGLATKYGPLNLNNLNYGPGRVARQGVEDVFYGDRILVSRGISSKGLISRFEQKSFCFTHSTYGIKVKGFNKDDYKILLAILWSKVTTYFFWLTGGTWGVWHDSLEVKELLNLPVTFPTNDLLRSEIIQMVDILRSDHFFENDLFYKDVSELEQTLNNLIFDLYNLTPPQRDLINDMCDVEMGSFYNKNDNTGLQPISKILRENFGNIDSLHNVYLAGSLESYIYTFLQSWQQQLPDDWELVWRTIYNTKGLPLLAVIFTIQSKEDGMNKSSEDMKDWQDVINLLSVNSLLPYNSEKILTDELYRIVTENYIIIIKVNEQRLWTKSLAREDAEATIVQAMNLQEAIEDKIA